jgi:hypothetical protein
MLKKAYKTMPGAIPRLSSASALAVAEAAEEAAGALPLLLVRLEAEAEAEAVVAVAVSARLHGWRCRKLSTIICSMKEPTPPVYVSFIARQCKKYFSTSVKERNAGYLSETENTTQCIQFSALRR